MNLIKSVDYLLKRAYQQSPYTGMSFEEWMIHEGINKPKPPVEIIEFCYRWPDGREEIRYTRQSDHPDCYELQIEIDDMAKKLGTEECPFPYFYRTKK